MLQVHMFTILEGAPVPSGILCFSDLTLELERTSAAPSWWGFTEDCCFSSPHQALLFLYPRNCAYPKYRDKKASNEKAKIKYGEMLAFILLINVKQLME